MPCCRNYELSGEELSMALRSVSKGYSLCHMPDVPLVHRYRGTGNRPGKLHWDPEDDENRVVKWKELDKKSLERLDALFAGNVEEPMNLGKERSLEDYASISGIDLKNKIIAIKAKELNSMSIGFLLCTGSLINLTFFLFTYLINSPPLVTMKEEQLFSERKCAKS